LMSGPANRILRLHPSWDFRELIGIDEPHRVVLAMSEQPSLRAKLTVVKVPAIEFEPLLLPRQSLDGCALGCQPGRLRQPPQFQAKPRGLLGAAIEFGNV